MYPQLEVYADFVARFHTGEAPVRQTDQQLDALETALATKLPASYRMFMNRHGTVHTPAILDEISDRELDYPDVQDFLDSRDAVDGTKGYWSAGMPEDMVGIASDCMGNLIGFRRQLERSDDAPVFFFDHDFVKVNELAPSFTAFLLWYLENLNDNQPKSTSG